MIQDFVMGKFYTFVAAEMGETTYGTVRHCLQCTLLHAYKCLNSSSPPLNFITNTKQIQIRFHSWILFKHSQRRWL